MASPHDLHDRLYWQVRVPRLLTGPKSLWRLYMDPVSPLLDIPMLELARGLPIAQRVDKTYLRTSLGRIAPDLMRVPFATRHSRVKWRRLFRQTGPLQKFIVETLLEPQPAFDRWFDRASIDTWLRSCMAQARQTPAVAVPGDSAMKRMRRGVTSLWFRRAFNPRVVLHLLTLKLWFHHFK